MIKIKKIAFFYFLLNFSVLHSEPFAGPLSLEKLRRHLIQLERNINDTKNTLKKPGDTKFVPNLYLSLAELLIEKSKYLTQIEILEQKIEPSPNFVRTTSIEDIKKTKLEAIEIYRFLNQKFPQLENSDRILFFTAHEWRELGQAEEMIKAYEQLIHQFPKSIYWEESHIILADHYLEEQKNPQKALSHYKKIIERETNPFTALAHYKMGWCQMKLNQFQPALLSFEKALSLSSDTNLLPETYRKTNVRLEALTALVWPYCELTSTQLKKIDITVKRVDPLFYFKKLSYDLPSYQKVLDRLSQRLILKNRFTEAFAVDRELFSLSNDLVFQTDLLKRINDVLLKWKGPLPPFSLSSEFQKMIIKISESSDFKIEEKKNLLLIMELVGRNILTKSSQGNPTKASGNFNDIISGYNAFLILFPQSPYHSRMRLNLAELYFKNNLWNEAGIEYENLLSATNNKKILKSFYDSAIESYTFALRHQNTLTQVQLNQSREGLREVGKQYIKKYFKEPATPEIIFNIGQSYYDERFYEKSKEYLDYFIKKYPQHKKIELAVHLSLDSDLQLEKYSSLIANGKKMLGNNYINEPNLIHQIKETIQLAELKMLQKKISKNSSIDKTSQLLSIAQANKGTSLADNALYTAFKNYKNHKDLRALSSGEQLLIHYKKSPHTEEVANGLAQLAMESVDFRKAGTYFEIYQERTSDKKSSPTYIKTTAKIRETLGDFRLAANDYSKLSDFASVARMDFLSENWIGLKNSATRFRGILADYFLGLAHLNLQNLDLAEIFFKKVIHNKINNLEDEEKVAQAQFLLTVQLMDRFNKIQWNLQTLQSADSLLAEKNKLLSQITDQLMQVIKLKNGRWTIAALFHLAQSYKEFASFLKNYPLLREPTATASKLKINSVLDSKILSYERSSLNYFQQCSAAAEKNEILTQYALGCYSAGKIIPDPKKDRPLMSSAEGRTSPEIKALRQKIILQPRRAENYSQLASYYLRSQDYGMSEMILQRALEFSPQNGPLMAELGVVYLHKQDLMLANEWFKKSLNTKNKPSLAYWGLSYLYQKYGFKTKARPFWVKAKAMGQPQGPFSSFINIALITH